MEEMKVNFFDGIAQLLFLYSIREIVIISIMMESTIENFSNQKEMWRNATKPVK